MELSKLYEIARENDITVDGFPMPTVKSAAIRQGEKCYVAIDPSVLCRESEERVCLAHEIGHCETAAFYNAYSGLDNRQKHEQKARRWAITRLVPLGQLKEAIKQGTTDLPALAERFGVTQEFMRDAITFYTAG